MKLKNIYEQVMKEAEDFYNDSGAKFWGNIGAGVLPVCSSTKRILVAMRSSYVNEPHTWGVIGGKLDEEHHIDNKNIDTDVKGAAKREFIEETGFNGNVKLHSAYIFEAKEGGNVVFTYYNFIGELPEEFDATPDRETSYFEWVTFEELMDLSPKHFGLENLLNDGKSLQIIKRLIQLFVT